MEVIGAGVLVKKEAMHYTLYISTRGAMIDCESSSVYVWMKLKLRAQNLCVYLKKYVRPTKSSPCYAPATSQQQEIS